MTQHGRTGASFKDWLERRPYILPIAILIAGAAFRFYNLNWDDGQQLHPDERWIYMVVSGAAGSGPMRWPASISQFLDIRKQVGSPLDPHFFAYGSLPFYLLTLVAGTLSTLGQHVAFLSSWSDLNAYGNLPAVGRPLSGVLDLLAVAVLFLIGRRIYGYWTGVLAMALAAFTVLDVQLSHFYTVDTVLLPLCLLTVLAAIHVVQTDSKAAYIWGGIAFGAAMATKTTALLLVVPLGAAGVLAAWTSVAWPRQGALIPRLRSHYRAVADRLNRNLQLTLGAYVTAAVAFVVCEPYAVLDRAQLLSDIAQQSTYLVTNDPSFLVPYTIQYAHTVPYLYQLENILFWSMGIPLGLAAFAGVIWALIRVTGARMRTEEAVLLLWVVPYFLFVGHFFAKFNRYMLPIMPVMELLGAAFLVWLVLHTRGRWRAASWASLTVVASVAFLYSLAYMNIYDHANTRVAASRWIYAHIPPGTTIATEGAWDDPLPLGIDGHSGAIYRQAGLSQSGLNLYDPDDQHKIANIADVLTHAQYIIMSSERMDRSIPRLPDRYPITTRYYRLLFSGRLNFRLVRQFQEHPQLGPIVVHDYSADESFHVYDHPNVRIFRRVSSITPSEVASLLAPGGLPSVATTIAPARPARVRPDARLMLSSSDWKTDQRGPTLYQMFPPNGFAMQHPILVWLLTLELLGLLAFPFCFVLLSHLADRGFVIAKTLGLLLVGYLVWIGTRLHLATFDRGVMYLSMAAIALVGVCMAYRLRAEIAAWARREWKLALAGEAVFLAGFAFLVLLRMWYPDLGHQFSPVSPTNAGDGRMGEKQMELAFLNGIVRSRAFPPLDPFFAHGYINYYYYGFFLVGMLCKLTQILPATGFNLAIATFFALLVGGVFSVVLNLTKRVTPGVVAALFVGVFGNLNGGWQLLRGLMSVATIHSAVPVFGGLADVLSGLQQTLIARQPLPPFDFWEPTRILPPTGQSIAEFPYFTYLFADLHPHLLAYPMTVAALAFSVELLLGSPRSLAARFLSLVVGAVLLGAIAVTNPWDYPTYLAVVGIGALVGAYALRRKVGWQELVRPVFWVAGLAALSFVLYLPFKRDYQTVFTTGIGLVRDITPQMLTSNNVPTGQVRDILMTPLPVYLEHFGLFLFIIASYLVLLLLRETGLGHRMRRWRTTSQFMWYYRERIRRVGHAMRVARGMRGRSEPVVDTSVLLGVVILVAGLFALQDYLLAFLVALLGLVILLLMRLAVKLPASQLFLLGIVLVPLGLSLATQVVFIKDWLSEGADFRMNTIFKFYNQAWILYAAAAAAALYYFALGHPAGDDATASRARPRGESQIRPRAGSSLDGSLAHTELPAGDARTGALRPAVQGAAPDQTVPGASLPWRFLSLSLFSGRAADSTMRSEDAAGVSASQRGAVPLRAARQRSFLPGRWKGALERPLILVEKRPIWSLCLLVLIAGSVIYTYAGTISRETYRTTWLKESSVPLTLDGMAFMKVAYPGDYAGISWLNAHVTGVPVIAEADDAYYNWRSRVSMFTGLPDIVNGIHESEQRYADELDPSLLCSSDPSLPCSQDFHPRSDDLKTLYDSQSVSAAWQLIRRYGVRYVYVGFSERQAYSRAGLAKFAGMVGHGLRVAFRHGDTVIYEVTSP